MGILNFDPLLIFHVQVLGGIVLPLFPKSSLQEAFEGGRVLVNGSPVQHHHLLSLNQSFEFLLHRHESKVCTPLILSRGSRCILSGGLQIVWVVSYTKLLHCNNIPHAVLPILAGQKAGRIIVTKNFF